MKTPTPAYPSLRAYLAATRTTQKVLAARVGITQAHLSQILSGARRPSVGVALAIEDATGVSVRALVRGAAA